MCRTATLQDAPDTLVVYGGAFTIKLPVEAPPRRPAGGVRVGRRISLSGLRLGALLCAALHPVYGGGRGSNIMVL